MPSNLARWRLRANEGLVPAVWCLILILLNPGHAVGQGCAQCLDSTRATPPQVQAAYRMAIYLLAGAALCIFCIGVAFLRTKALRDSSSERSAETDAN